MFGISLGEFLLILVIAIVVIGPKDLPEVARYIIKAIARIKHFIAKAKAELDFLGKEIGIEEIKNEIAVELAAEKTRMESEITTIIDLYGNEHKVLGLDEAKKEEAEKLNLQNSNNANSTPDQKTS